MFGSYIVYTMYIHMHTRAGADLMATNTIEYMASIATNETKVMLYIIILPRIVV